MRSSWSPCSLRGIGTQSSLHIMHAFTCITFVDDRQSIVEKIQTDGSHGWPSSLAVDSAVENIPELGLV